MINYPTVVGGLELLLHGGIECIVQTRSKL